MISIRTGRPLRLIFALTALWGFGFMPRAEADAQKPNIVFILADDLGWKDLGCYGTYAYKTPHIDELAREGMRFTNYYAYPSCSPSRSGIITGMDPARLGITEPVCHQPQVILHPTLPARGPKWEKLIEPSVVTRLDTRFITYASVLKDAGYVTAHFGKWHLGAEPYSPLQHGFDIDFPHFSGPGPGGSFLAPWNKQIMAAFNPPPQPGEHLEDAMAQKASEFIDQNKDHPFLLDYWAFSVHSPLNAKEEYIDEFKDIADSDHPQRNPVYAAMVKSLDDAVGTLMDTLKKDGLENNTIVIFSSDNGGLEFQDGGGMAHKEYRGNPATNNAPLRGGKGQVYDGGMRVPLIVKWPGVTKPGTVTHALDSCVDIDPTVLEMAGLPPPGGQPLDGVSFVPVLQGVRETVRHMAFCIQPQYERNYDPPTYPPSAVIVNGDWKLIRFYADNPDRTDRTELYNLKDDIGETFDLSAALPDIKSQLSKQLDDYIAHIQVVMPAPNPNYNPAILPPPVKRLPSDPYTPPYGD